MRPFSLKKKKEGWGKTWSRWSDFLADFQVRIPDFLFTVYGKILDTVKP